LNLGSARNTSLILPQKKHLSSIGLHEIALDAKSMIDIAMLPFGRVTLQASI